MHALYICSYVYCVLLVANSYLYTSHSCYLLCLLYFTEEEERAYYLKTMAERKQKFKVNKKKINQRGKDKVTFLMLFGMIIFFVSCGVYDFYVQL